MIPKRLMASVCMTRTTREGKYLRMSPSQRATLGAEPSRPPRPLSCGPTSYKSAKAVSIALCPSDNEVGYPLGSTPRARRQRCSMLVGSTSSGRSV